MDAPRQPEVDYQWPEKDAWPRRARRIMQSLASVKPTAVSFYVDEALPWVVVWYHDDEIVLPAQALAAGEAIQAVADRELYFHGLRPSSALYILNDRSLQTEGEPQLGPEEYAAPFKDVKKAWASAP